MGTFLETYAMPGIKASNFHPEKYMNFTKMLLNIRSDGKFINSNIRASNHKSGWGYTFLNCKLKLTDQNQLALLICSQRCKFLIRIYYKVDNVI